MDASVLESRRESVSRTASRLDAAKLQRALDAHQAREARAQARAATQKAIRNADTRRWTTAPLNLWTAPSGKDAKKLGLIDELEHVLVTGRRASERVEIVINHKARWVTAGYLADKKPLPPPPPAPERSAASSGSSGRSAAPRARPRGLHQRHLGAERGQPQHRQGARGRLRGLPGDHDVRDLPR